MKKSPLSTILLSLTVLAGFTPFASASNEMDAGMALFKKGDYKAALGHFIREVKANPKDYNALYYEAVTFHQLKDTQQAKVAYQKIIKNFPGTPAAVNANSALMYIDPVYAKQHPPEKVFQLSAARASERIHHKMLLVEYTEMDYAEMTYAAMRFQTISLACLIK